MAVRTQGWKEILMLLVVFYTYEGTKACTVCTFLNQTTDSSNCSEPCGGGSLYYFHYICCGNDTKSNCEAKCNLTLTITKSLQVFEGCNRFCYNGGIFNETLETCLCSLGTSGRCCENNVTSSIENTRTPTTESGSAVVGGEHLLSSLSSQHRKDVTSSIGNTRTPTTESGSAVVGGEHLLSSLSSHRKETLYVAVGVPLSVIAATSAVILFIFVWYKKRKRRQQVDIIENEQTSID